MACPYFYPTGRMKGWTSAPRTPLGAPYDGRCQARDPEGFAPLQEVLRELCNFGYARGRCPHYPEDAEVDAVRFDPERYIFEKDYAPRQVGAIATLGPERLRRQAQAYLDNWKHKSP